VVESQPSKLLVAGSIPVSRSSLRLAVAIASARLRLGKPLAVNRAGGLRLGERCQGEGCLAVAPKARRRTELKADVAQLAERVLGKDEVTGSIPVIGSSLRAPDYARALRLGEQVGRAKAVSPKGEGGRSDCGLRTVRRAELEFGRP
jgi:hypothetical protein